MDNFYTISFGREFGSGGAAVGKLLAEKLNASYYDKEILFQASKESGLAPELFEKADERMGNPSTSFLGGIMGMQLNTLGECFTPPNWYFGNERLFQIQSEVMIKLAQQGDSVFMGRCADYVLREMPNLFSVFLTAKKEDRIRVISEKFSMSSSEAESLINKKDKQRAEYYNYYTFKKWGGASSYDLCVNVSQFGIEGCVDLIISTLERRIGSL